MSSKMTENNQILTSRAVNSERGSAMKDPSPELNYADIPGLIDPGLDVLNQLNANLKMLNDLHQRLQFTVREIKSVIRS